METLAADSELWEDAGGEEFGAESPEEAPGERDAPTRRCARRGRRQARPQTHQVYDVRQPDFWDYRHVPPGSVLVYQTDAPELEEAGNIAVLVQSSESTQKGIWLDVKILGCQSQDFTSQLAGKFRGKKRRHHICCPDADGDCPVAGEVGVHLRKFGWFPPGDFTAEWLSRSAVKAVKGGIELQKKALENREKPPPPGERPGDSGIASRPVGLLLLGRTSLPLPLGRQGPSWVHPGLEPCEDRHTKTHCWP